jgi:hypothetical protein
VLLFGIGTTAKACVLKRTRLFFVGALATLICAGLQRDFLAELVPINPGRDRPTMAWHWVGVGLAKATSILKLLFVCGFTGAARHCCSRVAPLAGGTPEGILRNGASAKDEKQVQPPRRPAYYLATPLERNAAAII